MSKKSVRIICRFGALILFSVFILYINQRASLPELELAETSGNRDGFVLIHFIDVGQGDAILVEAETSSMLIDAGENHMASTVVKYLKTRGIEKLEYIIGTHPHSDHIGGLDYVITTFGADKILMPEVLHTTKTYEDVLDAIEEKGLVITKPRVGDNYSLGPASFTIIAPNGTDYTEMNNYSIGIKLEYKNISFLMAGDAEVLSETEMLKNGIDLSADVLKISHHGSESSSCSDFLDAVNPSHAVISVGTDNGYGHPHDVTLQALADRNISIYRTDKQRNVIFTTNGKTISVNTEPYLLK